MRRHQHGVRHAAASRVLALLAANNALLFIDLILVPGVDLSLWRGLTALVSVSLLLLGLIWESR